MKIVGDISLLLFLVTATHLFMSAWLAKLLHSVGQDGFDISQGQEDRLGLESELR